MGKPQVLYCSTIDKPSQAEKVFDKAIGETAHHGHVELSVKPAKRGSGNTFHVDEALDNGLKAFVMNGLEEACLADPEFGYDGCGHRGGGPEGRGDGQDHGQGLKIAAQMALQDALKKGGVAQLEPIMELDAMSPEAYVGDVVGDLSARKASIEGFSIKGKYHEIKAYVRSPTPSAIRRLRSLTRGRGASA